MKKILLVIAAIAPVLGLSQNTFPSSGNVGIGTSNPATLLHIRGGSPEQIVTFENPNVTGNLNKLFLAIGVGGQYPMGYGALGGYDLDGTRVDYMQFTKGPTWKSVRFLTSAEFANNTGLSVNSTGIGATVPIFHFTPSNELRIGPQYPQPYKSTFYIGDNTVNYDWKVFSSSASLMTLTGSGNLGLGLASPPSHRLDVKDSSPSPAVLINNVGNDRRHAIAIHNTNAGPASVALYKMFSSTSGTEVSDGADIGVTSSIYNQANYGSPGGNTMVLWNYENGGIVFGTNNSSKVRISPSGDVGIGTNSPNYKLDVAGSINATSILVNGEPLVTSTPSPWTASGSNTYYESGNVGIGTTTPDSKLSVNGTIHTKEVKVDLNNWPDYVFNKEYSLQPLSEVKQYIDENGHLPGVPTATDVKENGVMLGEMNKLLLQKIEELTIHLIKQNKISLMQAERIGQLEERLKSLEANK